MRGEVLPILFLTALGVTAYVFWDQLLNLLNLQRASESELKYIARKVATYIKYSQDAYKINAERIEHELAEKVYNEILDHLQVKAFKREITIYSADEMNMYMLPNGSLFITDSLLNSLTDARQLIFLILRHFELLRLGCLQKNLAEKTKYGDFRRQFFFFKSRYTGYDILFIDYLTNMRYTLDQINQADVNAIKIMQSELSIPLTIPSEER